MERIKNFFAKPFWSDWRTIAFVYTLMPIIISIQKWGRHCNTYQIYKSVYYNCIDKLSLFDFYPYLEGDCNHYGPIFAFVIAPFALLQDSWGLLFWEISLVAFFFISILYMPLQRWQKVFMFWFCAHEVMTPLFVEQYDLAIAATFLIIFACVEKQKPIWTAFFIMLTIFIKLYGIMGFAFFFFIKDKKKFILACLGWAIIFFVAPMFISSPDYIVSQYYPEWYESLVLKNNTNMFDSSNNTSLLGMVRKISHCSTYSDLWLIIPGCILFLTPFRRIEQYKNIAFRYAMYTSVVLFICLFSTETESYGYISAMTGFVVWYVTSPWKRNRWDCALLVFAFIFTSLCTSDVFFPRCIYAEIIRPYALKALPSAIIWFYLMWEMNFKDYTKKI